MAEIFYQAVYEKCGCPDCLWVASYDEEIILRSQDEMLADLTPESVESLDICTNRHHEILAQLEAMRG